jgi:hypothetical protein
VPADGSGFTVITTVLVAGVQVPASVVNVRVTVPLEIEGVYVELSNAGFPKVPLGADHVEVVALPPMLPESVIVPNAHTDCGVPALAVGQVCA